MKNNEEKKLFSPVRFEPGSDNKELLDLSKSVEEKKYYVMYTDNVNGDAFCEIFIGRTSCYRGIERILKTFDQSVDAREMKVLVEIIGIDRKTGKYRVFLMNPDDPECLSVYDFCKSIESQYPDNFDVDEYTDFIDGEEIDNQTFEGDNTASFNTINPALFGGDAEVANAYAAITKEQINESLLFAKSDTPDKDLFSFTPSPIVFHSIKNDEKTEDQLE